MLPLLKQLPQHSWCYMQSWCIQLNAVKLSWKKNSSWNSIDSLFQCILRFFSLQFRLFWSHTAQHLLCIEQFTVQNLRFSLNLFVSIHSFLLLSLSLFAWILLIFFHSMFFSLSLYHTLSLTIIPSTILYFSENSKTFWKRSLVWMVDKIY